MLRVVDRFNDFFGLRPWTDTTPPVGACLHALGATILCLALSITSIGTLALWFGGRVGAAVVPAACVVTAITVVLWTRRHRPDRWLLGAAVLLSLGAGVIGFSTLAGGRVLDATFDAQWYHQEALIHLSEGWNPVYHELDSTRHPEDRTRMQLNGYPKATWIWGSALYAFTGRIEHAKAFSLPLLVAAFAVTCSALLGLGRIPHWIAVACAMAMAANPIAVTQILNVQLDGDLVSLLLIAVASLLIYARSGSPLSLATLAVATALGINVKLSAPAYFVLLISGGVVFLLSVDRARVTGRLLTAAAGGVICGGFILGFHPYVTNLLRHDHPLYPVMGPDKVVMIQPAETGRLELLAVSVLSRSHQVASSVEVDDALDRRALKLPFTVDPSEVKAFIMPDIRVGGWGPLFSSILLMAAATFVFASYRDLRWCLAALLVSAPVVVTVLIFPHPWFARFVPQGWLAPLVLIPLAWASRRRWPRILAALTVVVALVNVSLVTAGYLLPTIRHSEYLKGYLLELASRRSVIELDLRPFRSNRIRLHDLGVQFVEVEDRHRRLQVYLGNPEPRILSVEHQENSEYAVVDWTRVIDATHYQVELMLPPPAGPGGGPLTVLRRHVDEPPATLPVPHGDAHVLVRSCNLLGCGMPSTSGLRRFTAPDRSEVVLGHPQDGETIRRPEVLFSWLPADAPGETSVVYHVEVEDLATGQTVVDEITATPYHGARFGRDGDWLVRISCQKAGRPPTPAQAFFKTLGVSAPTMLAPDDGSSFYGGEIELEWSPVPGIDQYEYFVAVVGESTATVRAVTSTTSARVPLGARGRHPTTYSAIVRACLAAEGCRDGSEIGWGPWSLNAGTGAPVFTVTPRSER
jgi:hypothetical protein